MNDEGVPRHAVHSELPEDFALDHAVIEGEL